MSWLSARLRGRGWILMCTLRAGALSRARKVPPSRPGGALVLVNVVAIAWVWERGERVILGFLVVEGEEFWGREFFWGGGRFGFTVLFL